MTLFPLIKKHAKKKGVPIHGEEKLLHTLQIPEWKKIAVALDFSRNDEKIIAYALAQGHNTAEYILIHVVETAVANYSGASGDDYETRKDAERLELYVQQLKERGYTVQSKLGYHRRVNEIVRLVKESETDLLVMGAHRHKGLMDFIYGATVDDVRHKLSIPVLIVN